MSETWTGEIPDWMLEEEVYEPKKDRERFISGSLLKLMSILSNAREDGSIRIGGTSPSVKVLCTLYLLILTACSRNAFFSYCVLAGCLVRYCILPGRYLRRIIRSGAAAAAFSMLLMLPAVFMGQPNTMLTVSLKVFISVSLIACLAATTPWNRLTETFHMFHIPDLFIFTFDLTLKYIVILGDLCVNILTALRLRSVGRNRNKKESFSGVLGHVFIRSREMAEEMYGAMQCRGFEGEYHSIRKKRFRWADLLYALLAAAVTAAFWYLERMAA